MRDSASTLGFGVDDVMVVLLGSTIWDINLALGDLYLERMERCKGEGGLKRRNSWPTWLNLEPDDEYQNEFRAFDVFRLRNVAIWKSNMRTTSLNSQFFQEYFS